MPGRQYTAPRTDKKPKARKKNPKRVLNAFAIAQTEQPDNGRVRKSRLGELEPDSGKRRRAGSDDESEEEEEAPRSKKLRHGDVDKHGNEVEGGSDSEGNQWITGGVDSDDDSSLDSDEAMGESDEERFAGFKFAGSSSKGKRKSTGPISEMALDEADIDLSEGESRSYDSDEESEDFAANAIDLAAALDQSSEDEAEQAKKASRDDEDESSEIDSEEEDSEEEGDTDLSLSDMEEDAADNGKYSALQTLISSMDTGDPKARASRSQIDLAQEAATPSEHGLNPKQKLTITDLLSTVTDPTLRKSLKLLASDGKKSASTGKGIPGKLSAPLPKRQQDKIDRAAAFDMSKEALSRWIETVKHNRRAEHLVFPLVDHDAAAEKSTKRLVPSSQSQPITDLEATIQNILLESGLSGNGKSQDKQIQQFEDLATNKMPIEEVRARRAELRRERELLFREEIRAKRIKKIKSKSYRRVHRKERERNALRDQQALAEAGVEPSEDEQERLDRRRAEERMGQRHRESKWAKGIKESGRAAWDKDARGGVSEMVRREEELRRRMHGKDVREEDSVGSDSESSEAEADEDEDDEAFTKRMQDKLAKLKHHDNEPGSKLASMKFMQKAEAARKAQNDEALKQLRREIEGGESEESDQDQEVGRRQFGPKERQSRSTTSNKRAKGEFEEGQESGEEEGPNEEPEEPEDAEIIADRPTKANGNKAAKHAQVKQKAPRQLAAAEEVEDTENPWLTVPKKSSKKKTAESAVIITTTPELSSRHQQAAKVQGAPKPKEVKQLEADKGGESDSEASFSGFSPPPSNPLTTNQALIRQAFAADDVLVEESFAAEKAALAAEEEPEQAGSNALPGWGNWVGPGLSKKEQERAKKAGTGKGLGRGKAAKNGDGEGVAAELRKDRKLDKVIISEKRVPKSAKYLASSLPHPFESKAQYERSLRLPMGPEFTTKTTFQGMTKPRVIMKGGVVAPMRKPLM